jgi:nanoRNase/pAp phosphatase (c-di-AMP/oligoRNAs hydrolase)
MKNYQVSEIKKLLTPAKTALVVVPQLSIDNVSAALALALTLKKKNIDTKVFCPTKPDANYSKLSGLELLIDSYNQNDLVITLDYPLDQIEKVNYNQDNGKLNLIVETKQGSPKVAENQINISSQSGIADINFILGDETLLGASANMVNSGNWIQISPSNNIRPWAKASVVDQDAPFCEIFTFLLPMIDLNLDMDSAKNLLIGLRVATQSFSINVSPETFEAGAICLRATQPTEVLNPIQITPPIQPNQFNSGNPTFSPPTV